MKSLILAVLACVAHVAAHGGTVSEIPTPHRVILSNEGKWIPTEEQVQAGLAEVQRFLENIAEAGKPSVEQVKSILASKEGYRVQAWGAERDGKKVILLNFFPVAPVKDEDFFAEWKKRPVWMEDGGYDFWNIEYDPATKRCSHFA